MNWLACGLLSSFLWFNSETGPSDFGDRMPSLAQAKQVEPSGNASPKELQESRKSRNDREVLAFVGQHQPRLLELMNFLKKKQPAQYEQALKEMTRSKQRLEGWAKRDQEMYAIELELWQTRSQLRLLAAEISVAKDEKKGALERRLAKLVEKEIGQNLSRLSLQQARLKKQLGQLDRQIEQHRTERDEMVARSLRVWQNRIAKQSPKPNKKQLSGQ